METQVTERMCKERHTHLEGVVKELKEEMKEDMIKIKLLLSGNGKMGLAAKVETMWQDHQARRKTSQGWIDWTFRILILMLLSWLGLK